VSEILTREAYEATSQCLVNQADDYCVETAEELAAELSAHDAALRAALAEAQETSLDLETRLSGLLDRLTCGLFSKPGYSVDQMESFIDEAYQKRFEEEEAEAHIRCMSLQAALAEAQRERDLLRKDLAAVSERVDACIGPNLLSGTEPSNRVLFITDKLKNQTRLREIAETERDEYLARAESAERELAEARELLSDAQDCIDAGRPLWSVIKDYLAREAKPEGEVKP